MEIKHTNGFVYHPRDEYIQHKFAILQRKGDTEISREEVIIDSATSFQKILQEISNYNEVYQEYGFSKKLITIE